jgi:EYS protein
MAYGVSSSVKDYMELKMRIIPQTLEQISLIAFMGQSSSKRESSDHFSITYVRGYLMLTWDLGSGVRRIFTNSPLNIRTNKVHTLQFGRRGRDSWLHIDGLGNITGRAAGTNTRLDVSPILYIGKLLNIKGGKAKFK